MKASTKSGFWLACSGLVGATGVLAGAFGAHGLKNLLSPEMLEVWNTAVHYHLLHAPALLGVALALHIMGDKRGIRVAGWCFLVGVVVFSGSLYLLAVTGFRLLGAVTPIGGLALVAGWMSLFFSGLRLSP